MAKRNEYTRKIDKIIGNKIRYLRLAMGVRIEELAKSIDVTRQQIEKYESGTNRISAGRMLMIAQALNETISYFYTDLDSKTSENAMTRPISKRQERVCMKLTRVCPCDCVNSLIGTLNPAFKFYQKMSHGFIPILNRHRPFCRNVINRQV